MKINDNGTILIIVIIIRLNLTQSLVWISN